MTEYVKDRDKEKKNNEGERGKEREEEAGRAMKKRYKQSIHMP